MPEKKSQAKQSVSEEPAVTKEDEQGAEVIPPVAFKPERSYTIEQVENAINSYYAGKGNKTPISVDLYDLKLEVTKSLKLL